MANLTSSFNQQDQYFSYQPMPFFDDLKHSKANFSKKLDLNLHCIKHPQQTCFIHITNENMLAWGIECGDIIVVEKKDSIAIGDLLVLEINDEYQLYEFVAYQNAQFIFFPLDSTMENISVAQWQSLSIIGTVTNTIHQVKPKNTMRFAA